MYRKIQKQLPGVFCKNLFLKISQNSQETPMPESLFNKVAGWPATLLKKRL